MIFLKREVFLVFVETETPPEVLESFLHTGRSTRERIAKSRPPQASALVFESLGFSNATGVLLRLHASQLHFLLLNDNLLLARDLPLAGR